MSPPPPPPLFDDFCDIFTSTNAPPASAITTSISTATSPARDFCRRDVDDLRVAIEEEVLARRDESEAHVAEIDVVALAQLDLAVLLAVDAHAVGALQIDDVIVPGLAHNFGVVARSIDG